MKIQVKETLARRRTVFVLTLAAIVGVCAFTFSGTQNYAWAEGEGPIATWNREPKRREMASSKQQVERTFRLK